METEGYLTDRRASFGTRFLAALIDGIIVFIAGGVFRLIGIPILGLLISLGYYTYFEGGATGQTIGKRAMSIRVVDIENDGPIGYARGAVRWIGRFISAIPVGLGYFWMLWDKDSQCWHDKLAACVVVPTESS